MIHTALEFLKGSAYNLLWSGFTGAKMTKGNLVSGVLVVVGVYLVMTGNWALALFGAVFVKIGRIAAMLIERRSEPPLRSHRFSK